MIFYWYLKDEEKKIGLGKRLVYDRREFVKVKGLKICMIMI